MTKKPKKPIKKLIKLKPGYLGDAIRELHGAVQKADVLSEFRMQLQPLQQEVAALVTEMRQTATARDNIGAAVARIESDVRALIKAISDASDDLAASHLRATIKQPLHAPAEVLPFPAKKRRKKKPEPPDDVA